MATSRFLRYAEEVFNEGYTKLAHVPFLNLWSMVRVAPQLMRLEAFRTVYDIVARYIKDEHLRQTFSFHSLLVGGNPFATSSIYTLIHVLERKWGVTFPRGGTGALVRQLVALFQRLGGTMRLDTGVDEILTRDGPRLRRAHDGWSRGGLRGRGQQRRRRAHLSTPAAAGTGGRGEGGRPRAVTFQHVAVPDLLRHQAPAPAPGASQRGLRPALPRAAGRHLREGHAGRRLLALPARADRDRPVARARGLRGVLRAVAGAAPGHRRRGLAHRGPALRGPHPVVSRGALHPEPQGRPRHARGSSRRSTSRRRCTPTRARRSRSSRCSRRARGSACTTATAASAGSTSSAPAPTRALACPGS